MAINLFFIGDRGPFTYDDSVTYNKGTPFSYTPGAGKIGFVEADPAIENDAPTITDSDGGFVTAGFEEMDIILVEDSDNNDGLYQVTNVEAGALHINMMFALTAGTPAGTVTVDVPSISALMGVDVLVANLVQKALYNVVHKTSAYSARYSDMIVCDGTFTVTLPDIGANDVAKRVVVSNGGSGVVTVEGDESDTIYDELNIDCDIDASLHLMADTTSSWRLV